MIAPTILIIEQNRYQALMMEREIGKVYPGSPVTIVRTGQDALDAVESRPFDLAILDFDLPDFEDVRFLELFRNRDIDLPIIALSTDDSELQAQEAFRYGVSELIVKDGPFHVAIPRLIAEVCRPRVTVGSGHQSVNGLSEDERAEFVESLVATLGHEINNPLMTILGMSELILDNGFGYDEDLTDKIKVIRRSALRIKSSLRRLQGADNSELLQTPGGKMIAPQRRRQPVDAQDT